MKQVILKQPDVPAAWNHLVDVTPVFPLTRCREIQETAGHQVGHLYLQVSRSATGNRICGHLSKYSLNTIYPGKKKQITRKGKSCLLRAANFEGASSNIGKGGAHGTAVLGLQKAGDRVTKGLQGMEQLRGGRAVTSGRARCRRGAFLVVGRWLGSVRHLG